MVRRQRFDIENIDGSAAGAQERDLSNVALADSRDNEARMPHAPRLRHHWYSVAVFDFLRLTERINQPVHKRLHRRRRLLLCGG